MKFYDHKLTEEELDSFTRITREVIEGGQYIGGERVEMFEDAMTNYFDRTFSSCNSGTDALFLALRALGVGEGDEVIVPSFTFYAPIEAIYHVGATPVLADIQKGTYNIDPFDIEGKITEKTKAVLPVHLFGLACDMVSISQICKKHKLLLIEDAAQAFGAKHGEKKVGTFGDVGCFSFFPTKNLGGFGDSGGVTFKDKKVAERFRMLKNHGQVKRYSNDIMGFNSRMDSLQAALLLERFKSLDQHLAMRKQNAKQWLEILADRSDVLNLPDDEGHTYNNFSILVKNRNLYLKELKAKDIPYMIYYEKAVYDQDAYKDTYGRKEHFANTEFAKENIVSLPIHS